MSITDGSDDIYNVDTGDVGDRPSAPKKEELQPLYQIYEGSRIAVSRQVGPMWERKYLAARKAHELVLETWDEVFKYYNNHQKKSVETTRGVFKRGDGTENVVFSNLNVMLPAVYAKDPDITCSTIDNSDEPFCKSLQALLNTLIRQKMRAKSRIKKAVGIGLLTNFGVLKLDYVRKDDSREMAAAEVARVSNELAQAKTQAEVEALYGQLEALEMNMEVTKPSGPSLNNVLPHNLIVDPYAEMPDGTDGDFMIERVHLPTAALTQRFTKPDPESEGDGSPENELKRPRVLIYKPTHKAAFDSSDGRRDDGIGFIQQAIEAGEPSSHHTEDERTAYLNMYTTECFLVWDKVFRRVLLFQRDDWTWPLWVWDDPLHISRFYPYFIIGYTMSTGGTVCVGETAYYLDQQDEINAINRKLIRLRTAFFDYFLYNSDMVDSDNIEKMLNAVRGEKTGDSKHVVGVKAGEKKIADIFEYIIPKIDQSTKELFDKQPILDAINRITNTSDALRGVQFKTNTNEDAVNTYQESMKLSVGAKVDVVEDTVADMSLSLAELCVQYMSVDDVKALIGETLGANYQQMTVAEFNANYNLEVVAGSMEKPNSVFKKKEAVQISQAVGQFAQAAPGATLRIMLRVLEQAFSEVVIKPEDWNTLDAEIAAKTGQGVGAPQGSATPGSSPGGAPAGVPTAGGGAGQPDLTQTPEAASANMQQLLQNIPDDVKATVVQMKQQGADPHAIMGYLLQHIGKMGGGIGAPSSGGGVAPQPQPQGYPQ